MNCVMTKREEHAQNLAFIADVSNNRYNRRFSFQDAKNFIETYEYYVSEGYPPETAADRAYDHYHTDRTNHQTKVQQLWDRK